MNIDCSISGKCLIDGIPAAEYFKDKPIDYSGIHQERPKTDWVAQYAKVEFDRMFINGSYVLDWHNPYYKPEQYFSGLGLTIVDQAGGTGWGAIYCKNI